MRSSQVETLRWQFQLTWKLAAIHLPHITDELCLWEPVPGSWNVRLGTDGRWRPDWLVPEPDPAPPVTIGWLTWQLLWWQAGLMAAIGGEKPPAHDEVFWPGSAAAVRHSLEANTAQWLEILFDLSNEDLERSLTYPWPEPRPLRYTLAWANSELMKNIAEIGVIRHLYLTVHSFNTDRIGPQKQNESQKT
jgi:hypothetical protein